ncbi:porin [Pelagibius sp. 7325]|uniref:porin n=1 Tax=Pelagibius sp. 7325 TaxID=3131994 RepID=UPI0030EEDAD5
MASSAIVGAAVLVASPAAAQELKLSAFQQFMVSGGDSDGDDSDRGFGFATNTEIHVNGSIMADNGITFGFRVELEADAGATNNVDENSVWASGGFGKLEFGNNDGVEDTFMVNGSNSGVDYGGVGNPTSNFLDDGNAFVGAARTSVDLRGGVESSDATKISYTTPNFSGFSMGLSYTPNTAHDGEGNSFTGSDDGGFHDQIGVGLGYEGEFNGFGLELALVGAYASADEEPEDDAYGIGGGIAVSFSGFTIATGAVYDDFDDNGGKGWAWDAGIGYAAGPWSFSVNGIYSEDDDSDDELLAGSANVGYNLAPGVSVFLTGYVGNEDLGAGGDNDIVAVTSGLKLAF